MIHKSFQLSFSITYHRDQWGILFGEIERYFSAIGHLITGKLVLPRWQQRDYIGIVLQCDAEHIQQLQEENHAYWTRFLADNPSLHETILMPSAIARLPQNSLLYTGVELPECDSTTLIPLYEFASDMMVKFGAKHGTQNAMDRLFLSAMFLHLFTTLAPLDAGNIFDVLKAETIKGIDLTRNEVMYKQVKENARQMNDSFKETMQEMIALDDAVAMFCSQFWLEHTITCVTHISGIFQLFGASKYEQLLILELLSEFRELKPIYSNTKKMSAV